MSRWQDKVSSDTGIQASTISQTLSEKEHERDFLSEATQRIAEPQEDDDTTERERRERESWK